MSGHKPVRVSVRYEILVPATILLIESAMYSVLVPLLPQLATSMHLTKSGTGVLYSVYMVGSVCGAVAGARIVHRTDTRRTAQMALVVLGVSGIGFALAAGFWTALIFRAVAGVGGGVAWVATMAGLFASAPSSKRGETVGTAMGVAIIGTLVGPLIGNAAIAIGSAPVFAVMAAVCFACALAVPPAHGARPGAEQPGPAEQTAERSRFSALAGSVWVMGLMAFAYGTVFVLFPLRLAATGTSELWIGWIFALCSLLSAVVSHTAGRVMDRVGASRLTTTSLISTSLVLTAFALARGQVFDIALIIGAIGLVMALGVTPNAAVVSLDADNAGMPRHTTSMIILVVFSGGEAVGGILGPGLAQRTSDRLALLVLAVCILTSVFVVRRTHRLRQNLASAASRAPTEDSKLVKGD